VSSSFAPFRISLSTTSLLRYSIARVKALAPSTYIQDRLQAYIDIYLTDEIRLIAFCEEHLKGQAIVVSQDSRPRMLQVNENLTISIQPWQIFLKNLWAGEVF
jgi:hypothetical protein